MTLVYASDKNYAALTAISAVSALRHNSCARIVLLGYNLEVEAQDIVRSRVEAAGGTFLYRDVSPALEGLKAKGYCGYTSYATYARIFIPEVLDDENRVIYLDGDTLVNGSLEELLSLDMKGCPFALGVDCSARAYKSAINHPIDLAYYNAGIMLIDIVEWRKHRCTERILDELANPRGPNPLGDQDVIIRCFPHETLPLAPKWNFLSQFFLFSYSGWRRVIGKNQKLPCTKDEYVAARRGAAIYHFSGHTIGRPWYTSSRHPMRRAYQEAAKAANLAEFAEQIKPLPLEYAVQYYLHKFLPQTAFDIVCNWLYRIHIWRNYRV